jgi:type IV secretory pathway VirB2 component (pilin)
VPTLLAQMERKADAGQIPAEQLDRIESQVTGPVAMALNVAAIVVVLPLMTLAFALLPWLAAGFMLGRRFTYRDSFVVTAWAGVVTIPSQILTSVLAWTNETMTNLHIGFGVLLPVEDPPSKLLVGLGTFLDHGIGPFVLWYLVVLALGAAAISGGPRRSVMLALGGIWLVVIAIISVLAAVFAPGA